MSAAMVSSAVPAGRRSNGAQGETTDAKSKANRRNALLSTGPKTPEGKAVVSRNAIRHGLTARELVLEREDAGVFAALDRRLRAVFAPAGDLEEILVDRIVAATWRLRRVPRVETEVVEDKCINEAVWRASERDKAGSRLERKALKADTVFGVALARLADRGTLEKLARYEAHLERSLYRALHELQRVQAARTGEHVPAPVAVDVTVSADGEVETE